MYLEGVTAKSIYVINEPQFPGYKMRCLKMGVVVHTFNPETEAGRSL